jgi:hypothetical protein
MHRLGAVAHKSSTCLCTGSGEAVLPSAGRQQRIGTGAGPCWPGQRAACECPRRAGPIARPLLGRTDVRRRRAHVVRRWEPGQEPGCALVGTNMIKVLATGDHYPRQMAAEFYAIYQLLRAFLCRPAQNLDICAMRANSQS